MKEPVNAGTHLAGAVLSAVGLVYLLYRSSVAGTVWHVVSFGVFAASLILLYTASTLYHALRVSPERQLLLRRIDHVMIFVLIAGSYTPFCLLPLRDTVGWWLLGAVWGLAALGILTKIFWMGAPRWLSTSFYLFMGWMVVGAASPLVRSVTGETLAWLAAGGLFYTVGAAIYATKWPRLIPGVFGFHEIWHLFVLAGSASHFFAVNSLL